MSSEANHKKQYEKNKKLLAESLFKPDNTEYRDWVVTIAFYCSIHLIERVLAKAAVPIHADNHIDRFNYISKVNELKRIRTEYQTLYNQSVLARYCCYNFSTDDVNEVLNNLIVIENVIA